MAAAHVPLRLDALALLLLEREKQEAKAVYLGNLQWSLLQNVYTMAGGKDWRLPSFGSFCLSLDGCAEEDEAPEDVQKEAALGIVNMLNRYLPQKGGEPTEAI